MALKHEFRLQGDYLFQRRGYLPLFILLPALGLYLYQAQSGQGLSGEWSDYIKYLGLGLGLIGLIIRAKTIGHVAPNTSGRNTIEGQKAEVLNTTGLYSLIRHPLYLGNFFMWLGPAIWTANLWFILFFILAFYMYYERIMYAEESFLIDSFGGDYEAWSKNRPAFIPRLSGYIKADNPFNWKKVVRQERSGFLALFLVFWLFDVLGNYLQHGMEALQLNFWSISLIVAFVIFAILKALKHSPLLAD